MNRNKPAKDALRRNKTKLQDILCEKPKYILNKVFEMGLITRREYNKLKSSNKDAEELVIGIVDKMMGKGEKTSKDFLELLQTNDDINTTLPQLKEIQWDGDDKAHPLKCDVLQVDAVDGDPKHATAGTANKGRFGPGAFFSLISSAALPSVCVGMGECYTQCSDYYSLTNNPRGTCLIINNEIFEIFSHLGNRPGTMEDEKALRRVFSRLGFEVKVHSNMSAKGIRDVLEELGRQNFMMEDALVVCVLTHGELGCVLGTDGEKVRLRDLTEPFTSGRSPTLAGKPKLFFIQACQGNKFQRGATPSLVHQRSSLEDDAILEEDSGPVLAESVPFDSDFLLGMATIEEHKSFRHIKTGSFYIQELCRQLEKAAASGDDILSVLTHVNREVGKGLFNNYKQMPQPKYTLTKKLRLTFI